MQVEIKCTTHNEAEALVQALKDHEIKYNVMVGLRYSFDADPQLLYDIGRWVSEMETDESKRSLSDLTDEELHKVAALCLGDEKFIITKKWVDDGIKYCQIEKFCKHPNVNDWIPVAVLQIDPEDADMPIIIGRGRGKELEDDLIAKPFELTRYLLSRGFNLYSPQTLTPTNQ